MIVRVTSMGYLKLYLLATFFLLATRLLSQDLRQHNWHFGNSTNSIRFNRVTNKAQLASIPIALPGMGRTSVATDPATGNLLFYTDGLTVRDATHQTMPNGTGLSGNVNAAICPVPGQPNKYFLFTNSASGQISSTVVDMAAFGNSPFPTPALGNVESANKNQPIASLNNQSEGMIILTHTNGVDFWLITHSKNIVGGGYVASLISNASYQTSGAAIITFTSILPTSFPISVASFSYNKELKKLAVAIQSVGDNAQILDFNSATGTLTLDRIIPNTASTSPLYDIQWGTRTKDANDNAVYYLYMSRLGNATDPANILQYDYFAPGAGASPPVTVIAPVLSTPIFESYGLQLAPDSTIYHLYRATSGGPYMIQQLSKVDLRAPQITISSPFGNMNFAAKLFPSFLPFSTPNITLSFTTSPDGTDPLNQSCQDNPITFFPNLTPNADSLNWVFGDGTGSTSRSNSWSPVHKYTTSGTFNVRLTAFYQGVSKTVTQPLTIQPFDLKIQLKPEETACKCELPINFTDPECVASPKPAFTVTAELTGNNTTGVVPKWSNGDEGLTLKPNKAGYYYLVAQVGGCTRYAGVNVKQYGLQDQRSNIWYFGNKAGIDFNPPSGPVALTNSAMNAPEGCAIVCDRNGQSIFYTNGSEIYDKNNNLLSGTSAGGDVNSTQSSLIIPVPGDETLFYLVTTQSVNSNSYRLQYTIYNLQTNKVSPQPVVLLFSKSTERITSNGQWLIAHEFGNSTFRTFKITGNGIQKANYSDVGSVHSFQDLKNGRGYMKIGPKNTLAVPIPSANGNFVELFHLNDTTGQITLNYPLGGPTHPNNRLDLGEPTGEVYGVEFRQSSLPGLPDRVAKLFVSLANGASSKIIEFAIDRSNNVTMLPKIDSQGKELGAIQTGPNGQIYVAVKDASQLAVITPGANLMTPSALQPNTSPDLSPGKSLLGLPNFIQQVGNAIGGPSITATGKCVGQAIQISGTSTDPIDEYQWTVRDPNGDIVNFIPFGNTATFSQTFTTAGTYKVIMELRNKCGFFYSNSPGQDLVIDGAPPVPTITVPNCVSFPVVITGNAASPIWSTGETTPSITLLGSAQLTLTDVNAAGCRSTSSATLVEQSINFDITTPQTVCEGSTTVLNTGLGAVAANYTFDWSLFGVNQPAFINSATLTVNTSTPTQLPGNPPLFYSVKVKDRSPSACEVTKNVTVTINPAPKFTLSNSVTAACGGNGIVTFQITAPTAPGGPYAYNIFGPFNPPNPAGASGLDQVVMASPISLTGRAGGYFAVVKDQISECTATLPAGSITDPGLTFTPTIVLPACDPASVQVVASLPITQFTVTNASTGAVVQGPTTVALLATFPINNLATGTNYVIELRSTSCTATQIVSIPPSSAPVVTISQNCLTLTATAGLASYLWTTNTPGTIVGPTNSSSIQMARPSNGAQVVYTLTASNGGCASVQNITVNVPQTLSVDFTINPPDGCAATVALTSVSMPTSLTSYRWFNGANVFLGSNPSINVTTTDTYRLDGLDANGCSYTTSKVVVVNGIVDAQIMPNSPVCDDGKPFTLTSSTNASGVQYEWFLDNSSTPISGQDKATIQATQVGKYTVKVSKGSGATRCTASDSRIVSRIALPQGSLLDAVIICADRDNLDPATNQVDLNPGRFVSYNWFKDGNTLGYTNQIFTATSEGLYRVDLTNSFGCVNADETEVLNECLPKIVGPNAFRPGSDVQYTTRLGTYSNKEFFVYSFFVTDNFEVAIYNRWGELVFQSKDRGFKWNGGYNNNPGQPLPGGTYTYVIRYQSSFRPQDGIKEQRGGVVLLR